MATVWLATIFASPLTFDTCSFCSAVFEVFDCGVVIAFPAFFVSLVVSPPCHSHMILSFVVRRDCVTSSLLWRRCLFFQHPSFLLLIPLLIDRFYPFLPWNISWRNECLQAGTLKMSFVLFVPSRCFMPVEHESWDNRLFLLLGLVVGLQSFGGFLVEYHAALRA